MKTSVSRGFARGLLDRVQLPKGGVAPALAAAARLAWLGALAGAVGLATPLRAADASLIYLLKSARYDQTGAATVQTAAEDPFGLEAMVVGTSSTSLRAGTLAVPGGGTVALVRRLFIIT
jgi:hypothetical protein